MSNSEQGSIKSYVIGFLLSLVFTFIPYYLVVNQKITGSLLLATILGFGVLQMLVQIFFFLHLGRGPKPLYNVVFFVSTVGIILVVVGGSILIINNLRYNMAPAEQTKKLTNGEGIYQIGGEETGACRGVHANHKVTISNGRVSPTHIEASRCDTLTFLNQDDKGREITFGSHPDHGVYAGEKELQVRKKRGKTLTLSESGAYTFHDHLDPIVKGSFNIAP